MKLLITGGAGFVGSNLALRLKEDEPHSRIVVLDNLIRKGSELNLPRLRKAGIKFIHGDIRKPKDLKAAGGFDLMLECSAEPSVLAGYSGSPRYVIDTNLVGSINCFEAARQRRSDILFFSTSRVYPINAICGLDYVERKTRLEVKAKQKARGISLRGIAEDFPLDGPRSLYGATKLASEIILQEYIQMYGIRGIINRCAVISGPWQMGKVDQGFLVLWAARHLYGGELSYIGFGGKGKQVRDVLHIDDLYALLRLQLKDIRRHSGKIYNVGGGRDNSVSLCELTGICQRITGRKIRIGSVGRMRQADILLPSASSLGP